MSRLVHFTASSASGVARAVSGAPRATLAVVLVVTLALGSVLPQLALVNSEEMWIPEGERADAYHAVASSMGSTEYVGVVARPAGGNAVTAAALEALLAFEDAAVHNSSVAEAFRFPRAPDANALSVADLVAEADAVLAHRASVLEPLAAALAATVNSTSGVPADQAIAHATAAARLLEFVRLVQTVSPGEAGGLYLAAMVPELEVVLLSGTDRAFKVAAVGLLVAATEFANWTLEHRGADPDSAALVAARLLVQGARAHLLSNASGPSKAAAAHLLENSVLKARAFFDLDAATAGAVDAQLGALEDGFGATADPSLARAYAEALAQLVHAVLFLDRLDPVAEPNAEAGLSAFSVELAALLDGNASASARAGAVSIGARLFEAVVAMGDRGLDLAVPQTNVSYESFSVSLNENATTLGLASATHAQRQAAATNLSLRTTAFLGNLINLNLTGIFTDQASFQRVLTMVVFLNETFAELDGVMGLPDSPSDLSHAAAMVSHEILEIVETTAPLPHHVDVNASAMLAPALRALEAAIRAGSGTNGPQRLEAAAGLILRAADFLSTGLLPQRHETLLALTADSLEVVAAQFAGGDPPASKATFATCVAASFAGARFGPSIAGANDSRLLLAPLQDEVEALGALLAAGQSPALFARFAAVTLATFEDGLTGAGPSVDPAEAPAISAFLEMLAPIQPILLSGSVSDASRVLFIAQAHIAAGTLQAHLSLLPPPPLPQDRTEAAARIHALGDTGVSQVVAVLLNITRSAPAISPSIPAGDVRFGAFAAAVAEYHTSLEDQLRAAHGYRTRTLLPNALSVSGSNVSASGTVVIFLFNGSLDRPTLGARESALRDVARGMGGTDVAFSAYGYGLMWYDTQAAMTLSVQLFALTMLAVMGAALWALYRNAFDVLLTVGLLGATVVWVLGTAALLGIAINPVTQVIPVLLIGLAEDYAVHITMGYRRNRAGGANPNRAVLAAVLGVGGVLFVATVTNGLSFLSFGGADIALIRDFGTLMALGLAYSFILTVTLIPAATLLADRRPAAKGKAPEATNEGPARPAKTRSERALLLTVKTCTAHPVSVLAIVALLTGAAAVGATSLETTFSYDQITATDLEVVRTLNTAQDSYGASVQRVFIVVEGDVSTPEAFLALQEAGARVAGDLYVTHVAGLPGVVSIETAINDLGARIRFEGTNAAGYTRAFADAFGAADWNRDGRIDGTETQPLTRAAIVALYSAIVDDPSSVAGDLVHRDANGAFDRAVIRVEVNRAVEHGDDLLGDLRQDSLPLFAVGKVALTGLPFLNRAVMQAVQDSGWRSVFATVFLALIILTVFFFADFRSVALGPLTIAPTLIAVAWTLGAMSLLGLALDMMTVMIATTTIGMGDLYAIHISHSFYRELKRNKDAPTAAAAMVNEAGAPLLGASVTTALGFLILVFAPVPVIQSYGLIFALSIVFAFLYSIVVMPILVLFLARATHKIGVDAPK